MHTLCMKYTVVYGCYHFSINNVFLSSYFFHFLYNEYFINYGVHFCVFLLHYTKIVSMFNIVVQDYH
jgi:hypothetical protein